MIGIDLDIERQTPGSSNMEAGKSMAKTDQYCDNGKLSNSDQNQHKNIYIIWNWGKLMT